MARELRDAGLRVEVDDRTRVDRASKIRESELRKVPYLLVVGDSEAESGEVAVRRHGEGDQGAAAGEFAAASWRRCRELDSACGAILARE